MKKVIAIVVAIMMLSPVILLACDGHGHEDGHECTKTISMKHIGAVDVVTIKTPCGKVVTLYMKDGRYIPEDLGKSLTKVEEKEV